MTTFMLHTAIRQATLQIACRNNGIKMGLLEENRRAKQPCNSLEEELLKHHSIWALNTQQSGFAEECRRQSLIAAASDAADKDLLEFMEKTAEDILGHGVDGTISEV